MLLKQLAMATNIDTNKYQNIIMFLVEKQQIGFDVALAIAQKLALKLMVVMFLLQCLIVGKSINQLKHQILFFLSQFSIRLFKCMRKFHIILH